MTDGTPAKTRVITPWAALAWGVAIDLLMCVETINGPMAIMLNYPTTFIVIMLCVPLVFLFLISLCNSPRYRHLVHKDQNTPGP